MTPYESFGYEVGDLFEVVEGSHLSFEDGSIISLVYDDGSNSPLFRLVDGECSHSDNKAYLCLYRIKLCNNTLPVQQITTPFGDLDKQTKKDLLCAWVDGADIEIQSGYSRKWSLVGFPSWYSESIFRVKPTISAKDSAKAKLISEAQQQLRDAQEALDKAQQL
jgi:hypothetical protein